MTWLQKTLKLRTRLAGTEGPSGPLREPSSRSRSRGTRRAGRVAPAPARARRAASRPCGRRRRAPWPRAAIHGHPAHAACRRTWRTSTPGCSARKIASSTRPIGITQTGQPGPCRKSISSGTRSSNPCLEIAWVCPPQTSMILTSCPGSASEAISCESFRASSPERNSSTNFTRRRSSGARCRRGTGATRRPRPETRARCRPARGARRPRRWPYRRSRRRCHAFRALEPRPAVLRLPAHGTARIVAYASRNSKNADGGMSGFASPIRPNSH